MKILHPSGSALELPIGFLEVMPRTFHPPSTEYTNTTLSLYVMQLTAATRAAADDFDTLKNAASDDSSWQIAVDACKYHLQSYELDEFATSLEYLASYESPAMDDDTCDLIEMYIEEWDDRIELYRHCIEFIKYLQFAVNEGCIAQIYFTPDR